MREIEGNIWSYFGTSWITVTTNIGWRLKKEADPADTTASVGPNPMGAGLAKDLAQVVPWMPQLYGEFCFRHKSKTPVLLTYAGVILFPTKALDEKKPNMSWKAKSNLVLIERGLEQLAALKVPPPEQLALTPQAVPVASEQVVVPLFGCQNGRLKEKDVLPLMHKYLDDRFLLVRQQQEVTEHPF